MRIVGFIIFLLIFLSIYGGIHYYFLTKARAAYSLSYKSSIPLILFIVILMFAPFITALLDKFELETPARMIAYIGYIWMGILFLFFSISVLIDLYRLIVYAIGSHNYLVARLRFLIPLYSAIILSLYGLYEATNIRLEKVVIKTNKLPQQVQKLKIAQITDVHLGLIVREYRLNKILKKVKEAEPDIFISTGDLVDADTTRLERYESALREIKAPYGKYAVTGNHEYYFGLAKALEFTQKAGFTMLRGQSADVSGIITIAGLDDHEGAEAFSGGKEIKAKDLLVPLDKKKFILLLKHQPSVDKNAINLFDLQLSGHTHHGQIFPFRLITRLFFKYSGGKLHKIMNSYLYVSRGSGTWGPPIRFLAPPEVTLIELIHE